MAVPVAAIAKKALEVLATNKDGRKFLGYFIGIVLFIVLLPVIVIFGLFGWMGESDGVNLDKNTIINGLPSSYQEQFSKSDVACQQIADTFTEQGLSVEQIRMAQVIYISSLVGKEVDNESFYTELADCFINASDNVSMFENINRTFDVVFTETDIKYFNELYGGAP